MEDTFGDMQAPAEYQYMERFKGKSVMEEKLSSDDLEGPSHPKVKVSHIDIECFSVYLNG